MLFVVCEQVGFVLLLQYYDDWKQFFVFFGQYVFLICGVVGCWYDVEYVCVYQYFQLVGQDVVCDVEVCVEIVEVVYVVECIVYDQ